MPSPFVQRVTLFAIALGIAVSVKWITEPDLKLAAVGASAALFALPVNVVRPKKKPAPA